MKILFLCSSLEPGRDGVGDYVRLLADACVSAGHECRLVALNDEHLDTPCTDVQEGAVHKIDSLRLVPGLSWENRYAITQQYVNDFQPDWLSWHVVPYGFHPKGVVPHELWAFSSLSQGRHVHAMLHELWIGLSQGEPLKNRAYGFMQRRALLGFLRSIRPVILHTSNVVYKTVLEREDCHAEILPLFGNVPVKEIVAGPPAKKAEWIGGIFGTVHPQFKIQECVESLLAGARASGRRLRILGIGRIGPHGEETFALLNRHYKGKLEAVVVGEKSPDEVSRLLQIIDFGIATHPWALLGKSGAVAAMLDHGLPVIAPRDDWTLRKNPILVPPIDPLVLKLSQMPPELMAGRLARRSGPSPRLPVVANLFLDSFAGVYSSHPSDL